MFPLPFVYCSLLIFYPSVIIQLWEDNVYYLSSSYFHRGEELFVPCPEREHWRSLTAACSMLPAPPTSILTIPHWRSGLRKTGVKVGPFSTQGNFVWTRKNAPPSGLNTEGMPSGRMNYKKEQSEQGFSPVICPPQLNVLCEQAAPWHATVLGKDH